MTPELPKEVSEALRRLLMLACEGQGWKAWANETARWHMAELRRICESRAPATADDVRREVGMHSITQSPSKALVAPVPAVDETGAALVAAILAFGARARSAGEAAGLVDAAQRVVGVFTAPDEPDQFVGGLTRPQYDALFALNAALTPQTEKKP